MSETETTTQGLKPFSFVDDTYSTEEECHIRTLGRAMFPMTLQEIASTQVSLY